MAIISLKQKLERFSPYFSWLLVSSIPQSDLINETRQIMILFQGIPAFLLATILSAMAMRPTLSQGNRLYSLVLFSTIGFIIIVILPSFFTSYIYSESKTFLDEIYFRCISLTTVGFGDIIPFNTPPERFAYKYHDHTKACLNFCIRFERFLLINACQSSLSKHWNSKSACKTYSMEFSTIQTLTRLQLKLTLLAVLQFIRMQFISVLSFMKQ